MAATTSPAERPLTTILGSLLGNVQEIARFELRLAAVEAREDLRELTRGAGRIAAGILMTFFAVCFLLAAAFIALSYVMPHWNAAVVIAGVMVTTTGVLWALYSSATKRYSTR